jgi:hypothetical protein
LRPLLEDTLLSSRARERGYFRPASVAAMVDEHLSRRADRTSHIWGMLMLELWLREFIDVSAPRADTTLGDTLPRRARFLGSDMPPHGGSERSEAVPPSFGR